MFSMVAETPFEFSGDGADFKGEGGGEAGGGTAHCASVTDMQVNCKV